MPVTHRTSPYIGVEFATSAAGVRDFSFRLPLERRNQVGNLYIEVQEGDTLHHIAHRVYGDAKWWWVLADYNGIVDTTAPLNPGTEIIAPPIAQVQVQRALERRTL